MQIEIALLCTVLAVAISLIAFTRNRDKDVKGDAEKNAELKVKLDHISQGVDQIHFKLKEQSDNIDSLKERVTVIDQSAKSAHRRLDEFLYKKD